MPTDEQLREGYEEGYEAAWIQRDAEVQALREALERADAVMLKAAHTLAKHYADANAADPLLEAVQQIRNTLAGTLRRAGQGPRRP